MRSTQRTIRPGVLRDVGMVALAVMVVGVSYGASATGVGLARWQVALLAVTVLAGSAELLFVGVVGAGGAPLLAAAAALLVNLRNGAYGMAAARFLGRGPWRWLGAHLVNDESVALASAQTSQHERRFVFWLSGAAIALAWPTGAIAGSLLGEVAAPETLGLDAVFPALLVALVLPALREPSTRVAASVGAVVALAATPWLPVGLAPLVALVGVPVAALVARARRRP
ncbi:4-azaleucine resistance transporter AzlC [Mumia flava]|uniref:4-azaleucine resistance transporter AzlC n=1 Tax=Mumia flava TaxID=1348852 RepID=A0A0B2B710_9ACTN|nr:AzlC family ABC transporter permease [Mumia flava]PJJ57803.1 4-azaleucine resistance transporter AzlC [Mumia flava]